MEKKTTITICVGSSCFARGNAKNVELVEAFVRERGLEDGVDVELGGSLCAGNCADGPIVIIDGEIHHRVGRRAMLELLNGRFPDKGAFK